MVASTLEKLIRGQDRRSGRPGSSLAGDRTTAAATESVLTTLAAEEAGAAVASERRLLQHREGSAGSGGGNPIDDPVPLEACDWLNMTACNTTGGTARWKVATTKQNKTKPARGVYPLPAPCLPPCSAAVVVWQGYPGGCVQPARVEPRGAAAGAGEHQYHLRLEGHRWVRWLSLGWGCRRTPAKYLAPDGSQVCRVGGQLGGLDGRRPWALAAAVGRHVWHPAAEMPQLPLALGLSAYHPLAGPEGESVAVQLVSASSVTKALQQLMADVNATCPTTFGDAGEWVYEWVSGWMGGGAASGADVLDCIGPKLHPSPSVNALSMMSSILCAATHAHACPTRRAGVCGPPAAPGILHFLPGTRPLSLCQQRLQQRQHWQRRREERCRQQCKPARPTEPPAGPLEPPAGPGSGHGSGSDRGWEGRPLRDSGQRPRQPGVRRKHRWAGLLSRMGLGVRAALCCTAGGRLR